jgi:hypothetical protein
MELVPPSAGDEREIGFNSADGGFISTANLKGTSKNQNDS